MQFDDHTPNFAYSLVATAPSPAASGLTLVVTAGQGSRFPTPPFNATIWPASSQPTPANAEIVRVTAISTDTLTIKRAQESTSARTVVIGDQIAATITAKTLTDVEAGFSPDLAVSALNAPRDNVIPALTSAVVASDYECGARYGTVNGGLAGGNPVDRVYAVPVTLPSMVVSALYVLAAPSGFGVNGNMRGAIYNNSGSAPSSVAFLATPTAYLSTDLVLRFVGPTTELAAGSYWLAIQSDTNNFQVTASATEATMVELTTGMSYASGLPDPFGTPNLTGQGATAIHALGEYATEIGLNSLLEIA